MSQNKVPRDQIDIRTDHEIVLTEVIINNKMFYIEYKTKSVFNKNCELVGVFSHYDVKNDDKPIIDFFS